MPNSQTLVDLAKGLENNRKCNATSRRNETDEQQGSHQNYDRLTHVHIRNNKSLEKYHA